MFIKPDQILYQDQSVIAINKPSGLLTLPDGYNPEIRNLKSELDDLFGRVWTVHRLDKETSGVIIFARTKEAHRIINDQFANRLVSKKYTAISHNIPDWENLNFVLPIQINGDRKHRTVHRDNGKDSICDFDLTDQIARLKISKIVIIPRTGYTHQIRCHLSYLGLPIVGDQLYTRDISEHQESINQRFGRLMLHATLITFLHPTLDRLIKIESPEPDLFILSK